MEKSWNSVFEFLWESCYEKWYLFVKLQVVNIGGSLEISYIIRFSAEPAKI